MTERLSRQNAKWVPRKSHTSKGAMSVLSAGEQQIVMTGTVQKVCLGHIREIKWTMQTGFCRLPEGCTIKTSGNLTPQEMQTQQKILRGLLRVRLKVRVES